MVFSLVFGGMGFFGLGISLNLQLHWIVPVVFELMILFGIQFINICTYGYVTDCLRDHAPEAFASLTVTKLYEFGIFTFFEELTVALNYIIADWLASKGPLQVLCIMGGTHVFVTCFTIPMYIYGKRLRSWTARNSLCQKILQRQT